MNTYLISYDLGVPETPTDYKIVGEHIKSLGNSTRPLKSLWLVTSSLSCEYIRDSFRKILDRNDKVLVVDVTGRNWQTFENLGIDHINWMQTNM